LKKLKRLRNALKQKKKKKKETIILFLIDQEKMFSSQTLSVLNSALTSDLEVLNIMFGRFSVFLAIIGGTYLS